MWIVVVIVRSEEPLHQLFITLAWLLTALHDALKHM